MQPADGSGRVPESGRWPRRQSAAVPSHSDMVLPAVLLSVLWAATPASATGGGNDHSVIAVYHNGIMHLDSSGALLAWRPEALRWWSPGHVATNPRNGTVCWISAPEDQSQSALVRCAELKNLNQTWDLPQPRGLRLNKARALAFDWLNENWYLTKWRVHYVCSYMFDRCTRTSESDGDLYFAAYDIPNRLLFRLSHYSIPDGSEYRLEVQNLDGTGKRVLPRPTDFFNPDGLILDPVRQHVYVIDRGFSTEIIRVDYAGWNRKVIVKRDIVYARSIDVINGYILVAWSDRKVVTRVSAADGKMEDLVAGAVRGESVPALASAETLLAVRIFSHETQPEVSNQCSDAGCQQLCIPTVVNDTAAASCFCPEGEELVDLMCHKICPAYAVVAGPDTLKAVDLQTEQITTILSDLTDVTKLDFFLLGCEEFLLFWVDAGSLFSGRWSPGSVVSDASRLVVASETLRVLAVAVDWAQRNLLWMERNPSQELGMSLSIKLAPFDGSYVKTLASDYWRGQQSLVVGWYGGFVHTARAGSEQYGINPEFRAWEMDGEKSYIGLSFFASRFLTSSASDIVIDHGVELWQDRIYWINNNTNSVEVLWNDWPPTSYKHAVLLTHPSLAHAGGLAVLDSRLFWTVRDTGRLWTADSLTGDGVRQLPLETGGGAVRVQHPWLQPPAPKPVCDEQRNGCSHFCVHVQDDDLKWVGQCACPDGHTLGDDKKTCRQTE